MTRQNSIVPVALDDRSYDIHIGPGLIRNAGAHIRDAVGDRPLVVLTDSAVAELHLSPLLDSLRAAGSRVLDPIVVPSGEASKIGRAHV